MSKVASIRELDSPADRIKAHRQADSRGILLVEGPADRRFVSRLSHDRWVVFLCGSRNNVKTVLDKARALAVVGIAGLIDRDFDDYYDSKCSSDPFLFTFDAADLEAHLFQGVWFEYLLDELGSEEKVRSRGGPSRVRELLTLPARCLGILRRANALYGWGVDFDDVAFVRKVNAQSLELDVDSLMASVRSRLGPEHAQEFADACSGLATPGPNALYRGKDALEVLAKGLARAISTTRNVDRSSLEVALRLSADDRLLDSSPFRDIAAALDGQP